MKHSGIQRAHKKSLKKIYKHLTPRQKMIVKCRESYDLADRELYGYSGFYAKAPRKSNGAVDWESLDERTLDWVERAHKKIDKYNSLCSEHEDEVIAALTLFSQTQFTYSQSF